MTPQTDLLVPRFHLKTITDNIIKCNHNTTSVVIGSRSVGKTSLIKEIVTHMKINKIRVRYITNIDQIQRIINDQKKLLKKKIKYGKNFSIDDNICIVIDELIINFKNEILRGLIFNGRCNRISVILSMSYFFATPVDIRCNIDYVFVARERNIDNIKRLYNYVFGGLFNSLSDFKCVLSKCTENYKFLVLDSHLPKQKLYWTKKTHLHEYKTMRNLLYFHRIKEIYIIRELI
jgi:AAA+ ATPase superfamily predicted ATPase